MTSSATLTTGFARAGALGYFPYAARTFQVLQEVIQTSYDQECHIFAPTCFPPLVTIYRKVIEWRIQNGTHTRVCRVCRVSCVWCHCSLCTHRSN